MNTAPSPAGEEENTIEASFAVLELCLEQLSSVAPVGSADDILDLIPDVSGTARKLILVELIKYDLTRASEVGVVRSLDFYWPYAGGILPQEDIPFDLVLEEVQLRRAAGDNPKWADYRQRFPDLADTIGKWLAGGDTEAVTNSSGRVPELPVGEQFDDFQILKQLGQGAFARVYLARQVSMHRLVALKATSRGSEEPQALSQLDHANVVRVYDQREVVDPPTILLYMQYLPGGTLADCIKHVRELPPEFWSGEKLLESIDANLLDANQTAPEQSGIRSKLKDMDWAEVVAWIGIQLAEGLDYANGKGVLHRDVKPANILLSAEAIPKLADFNVSCSGLSGRAGAAAYFGGSLAYMSPEQLQVADPTDHKEASELDGRSDLYALGIVLWELWQGKRPWTMSDVASNWTEAVLMQKDIRRRDYEPMRKASTAAERVLEKVLRSLLQVDPDQRPATGKETAARLRLAFYPELASKFEPSPKSLAGRLLNWSVVFLSALLIFGPNTAAAIFNYTYNLHCMEVKTEVANVEASSGIVGSVLDTVQWIVNWEDDEEPPIVEHFRKVSNVGNFIVFPLGGILFWIVIWPFTHIVHRGKLGKPAEEKDIQSMWTIGYRATLIAFILWIVSGIMWSVSMWYAFPDEFLLYPDGVHFFLSLALCGGVAWIYPYYGMTLLSLLVYYPKVVAPSMQDPSFSKRCSQIRRHSALYLLSALAIPIAAVVALLFGNPDPKWLLPGVVMTLIGSLLAFYAHNKINQAIGQYEMVLAEKDVEMGI